MADEAGNEDRGFLERMLNFLKEVDSVRDPNVMHVTQGAKPWPAPHEILVKVAYAGVNRPDCLQRSGRYPPPAGASPILGLEVSGEVVGIGEGVTRWRVGDQVCGLCNGGGYAEWVCIPEGQALAIPKGLSLLQAAALPENLFTVWTNVFERGGLQAGESLLVHGGSSGIGLTAIQLAKAFSCSVLCTVGSDDKADRKSTRLNSSHIPLSRMPSSA